MLSRIEKKTPMHFNLMKKNHLSYLAKLDLATSLSIWLFWKPNKPQDLPSRELYNISHLAKGASSWKMPWDWVLVKFPEGNTNLLHSSGSQCDWVLTYQTTAVNRLRRTWAQLRFIPDRTATPWLNFHLLAMAIYGLNRWSEMVTVSTFPRWWFQPSWNILIKLGIFPK